MAKITKASLQKQIDDLEAEKNTMLMMISQLEKEKLELTIRLEWYEKLPENAQKVVGDMWNGLVSVAFPPQKQEQKQQ